MIIFWKIERMKDCMKDESGDKKIKSVAKKQTGGSTTQKSDKFV